MPRAVAGTATTSSAAEPGRFCAWVILLTLIDLARISVVRIPSDSRCSRIHPPTYRGDPGIRVAQLRDWLSINPQFLEPGEIEILAARLCELLAG